MGSRGSNSASNSNAKKMMKSYKMSKPTGDLNDKKYRTEWIDKQVQENRKYLGSKNTNNSIDNVKNRAKAMGVSLDKNTLNLNNTMKNSKGKYVSISSNGIAPHANIIMNQMQTAKKFSPYSFDGISHYYGSTTSMGKYNPKTGQYMINLNAISLPRLQTMAKNSGMVAKTYEDYINRQIGVATFNKARVSNASQLKSLKNTWEKSYKNNMSSLSKRAGASVRNGKGFTESFAEGFSNLIAYRQGRVKTLHPFAKEINKFLKSIK